LKLLGPPPSSAELDIFQQDILRRWRELYGRYPENRKVRAGLGAALWDRASSAAQRFNKPQEAITVGRELQENIRTGMANEPKNKLLPAAYAGCLGVLAIAYEAVGEKDKAVQASEEAEAFYDKAVEDDPGNLRLLADAADAARNLSYRAASISKKRSRDAELIARERYRTLTALDPANAEWRYNFAMTHMMECYYLEGDGQIEAARQAFKRFDSLIQNLTLNRGMRASSRITASKWHGWPRPRATMPMPAPSLRPPNPGFRRSTTSSPPRRLIAFRPASAG
jgi:tetratricopeptide (TPR) repeat protein